MTISAVVAFGACGARSRRAGRPAGPAVAGAAAGGARRGLAPCARVLGAVLGLRRRALALEGALLWPPEPTCGPFLLPCARRRGAGACRHACSFSPRVESTNALPSAVSSSAMPAAASSSRMRSAAREVLGARGPARGPRSASARARRGRERSAAPASAGRPLRVERVDAEHVGHRDDLAGRRGGVVEVAGVERRCCRRARSRARTASACGTPRSSSIAAANAPGAARRRSATACRRARRHGAVEEALDAVDGRLGLVERRRRGSRASSGSGRRARE